MIHLGDFPASHTAVCIPFDSFAASTGASSAASNFAAGDVLIYKDGGTTQRSSSAGITVTTSFDSQTGLQMIVIDLSDNTDAGFYAAGHEYQVGVADITIDGQTVRFWAATFSIERALATLALIKARLTGDIMARVGAPVGASLSADIAGVQSDTDNLQTRIPAALTADGNIKADALRVNGTAQTAGDLAALLVILATYVDTEVAAIKAKTDNLPASPAAVGDIPTAIQNADALLNRDMSTGTDSGSTTVRTVRQALRFLRNKWSISGGTLTVLKEDDSTSSWTASVSTTAGDPVSSIDPAGP